MVMKYKDILLYYFIAITVLISVVEQEVIAGPLCTEYRIRSNTVNRIADDFVSGDALLQGHIRHAQFDIEQRPLPKLSVIETKRAWAKFIIPKIEWLEPNILFYTIYNQRLASRDSEVINLPFNAFWCIATRGDVILLSDDITHHYTRIASIDRAGQTVDMIDRWPDILQSFVEFSPKTIKAQSGNEAGRILVRFSRSNFEKLFIASITLDTADLPNRLEKLLPSELWTPELYIALGRTLLYASQDKTFPFPAAQLLIDGVRAAGRADKQELVKDTIPTLFTALVLAHFAAIAEGNKEIAKRALQYISDVNTRYGNEPIKRMDAEDALRISVVATNTHNWEDATVFLEQAITKNPNDYRVFLQKAILARDILSSKETMKNLKLVAPLKGPAEAITFAKNALQDVEKTLLLIEKRKYLFDQRLMKRKQKRGIYWELGWAAEQVDEAGRDVLKKHKEDALNLLKGLRHDLSELETDVLPTQQQ